MKQRNKPLVVVTGPAKRLRFGWWATRLQLWRVGVRATYVTARHSQLPDKFDGVIISGGDDIDPKHYGRSGTAGANYDPARDALEMSVIEYAFKHDLPILGICRGAQLLNVVCGGNLHQDIRPKRKHTPNRNSIFAIKTAHLCEQSQLQTIFEKTKIGINSLHSQAIDETGSGLVAVAVDADNFIQAVEHNERAFVVGVQWHPEYMLASRDQSKLFRAYATAVGG